MRCAGGWGLAAGKPPSVHGATKTSPTCRSFRRRSFWELDYDVGVGGFATGTPPPLCTRSHENSAESSLVSSLFFSLFLSLVVWEFGYKVRWRGGRKGLGCRGTVARVWSVFWSPGDLEDCLASGFSSPPPGTCSF